jgi:hypothetical protein
MSRISRVALVAVFALAYLCQPLALDACSVSCEAARAARQPAVAAPCHHTTSCATQISQPASPGSAVGAHVLAPPVAAVSIEAPSSSTAVAPFARRSLFSSGPPIATHLRL